MRFWFDGYEYLMTYWVTVSAEEQCMYLRVNEYLCTGGDYRRNRFPQQCLRS
jgi:hypothetical protein